MKFDVSILIFAASNLIDGEVSRMASHSTNLLWNESNVEFCWSEHQKRYTVKRNSSGVDRTTVRFDFCRARVDVICTVARVVTEGFASAIGIVFMCLIRIAEI